MEVFAAYTAQTDYEVGRVLDALEEIGQLHNTLIFWEIGDNGASMDGTLSECFNEIATLEGVPEDASFLVQHIDELGSAKASVGKWNCWHVWNETDTGRRRRHCLFRSSGDNDLDRDGIAGAFLLYRCF